MDGPHPPGGYGWPDVAMQALLFAQAEPWQFAATIGLLLVFVLAVAVVAYIFMPKTAKALSRRFTGTRKEARNAQPAQLDLGNDDA